jgi:hypothetical protein
MMKLIVIMVLLIIIPVAGFAQDYIKKDPLIEDRINIYHDGQLEGYLKKDQLIEDRINQYDKRGRIKGHWKKDPLFKDRYNFEPNPSYDR